MNRPSNYLLEADADARAREINFAKTRNFRPRPKSDDTKLSEGIERSARKQPTCPRCFTKKTVTGTCSCDD